MDKKKPDKAYEPLRYVEHMMAEEEYFEAIIVLSSIIELFLVEIVMAEAFSLSRSKNYSKEDIKKQYERISFDSCIRSAASLGLIDKRQYAEFQSFKRERNAIVHNVFSLRRKTTLHLKQVAVLGKRLYIDILNIRRTVLPKALFIGKAKHV